MSKSTYAACQGEKTGESSVIVLFCRIDSKQVLRTLELEFTVNTPLYRMFFNDASIEVVISRVQNELINFGIRFENKAIVEVVSMRNLYQQKQFLVFSSNSLDKICQYKVLAKAKTIIQEPLKTTIWNTPVQQRVSEVVKQGTRQLPLSDVRCEQCNNILTKGEADFCRQNKEKFSGRKLCIACIMANHKSNK